MKTAQMRIPDGGLINRNKKLRFTFNGKMYTGYAGDTLASALLANDVILTARSFRYHRPRGIFSAGIEECSALVSVGEGNSQEPNVRATLQPLYDGLVANSQSGWPSVKYSIGGITGWLSSFLPTGFYYKTFQWPHWKWYEGFVRHMAGIAPTPSGKDPDRYDKQNAHCDLLIVGAGPAGLAAALAASGSGCRIILVDDQPEPGGSLLWDRTQIAEESGVDWVRRIGRQLADMGNVTILSRTTVVAAWDHGYFTATQHFGVDEDRETTQRLWKIRSRRTILATGAIERPLVFPNNDRPGIILADSARQYVNRYAVRPGEEAIIYTNNDSAYHAAVDLHEQGVAVRAIVDVREQPHDEVVCIAREKAIDLYCGYEIVGTRGCFRISGVTLRRQQRGPAPAPELVQLQTDLLCVSGGWNPTVHLLSQAGGSLAYDEETACFAPSKQQPILAATIRAAGSADGVFGLAACLSAGDEAGIHAVEKLTGKRLSGTTAPITTIGNWPNRIQPHWHTPPPVKGRQWVDYLHDVTSHSIEVAALEGFTSIEHMKRYTTAGMSCDQGKVGNVNALAILAKETSRCVADAGTTKFRPPYHPVTLGALAGRETGPRAWPMRKLALHDWHIDAGAVMEDHSGWQRAAYYPRNHESEAQAIRREVLAVRNSVALFDGSSLGKIEIVGPDAAEFLNRMYINNVETLKPGRVRYGMLLSEHGVIADDGVFARLTENSFLVSTSSAGTTEVLLSFENWLQTEWPELDVVVNNATTQWATLTVTGPNSRNVICEVLPGIELGAESFPHMSVLESETDRFPYRLMRVSFTGEMSYELSVPARHALDLWQQLATAGLPYDITPLGMEALDVLRVEKGYLEVGVDTDVSTSPLDVGWATPIAKKTADFVGKRSLALPAFTRPDRLQLVGLKTSDTTQFVPVGSHVICQSTGKPEGHITSSVLSPTLGCSISIGMLKSGHSREGDEVIIDIDRNQFVAKVVPLTFYDPEGNRLRGNLTYKEL